MKRNMTAIRGRFALGVTSVALASVGCNSYPVAHAPGTTPMTQSLFPGPGQALQTGSQATNQVSRARSVFSYSEGAPSEIRNYLELCLPKYVIDVVDRGYQSSDLVYCDFSEPAAPGPTPKPPRPTPTPSPSPTTAPSPSPRLPSGARPSVKPRGEGIYWFRVHHYFSPNDDTRKDAARVDVVVTPDMGPWELSVDGQGIIIARGEGPKLNFPFDGKRGGKALPDGEYTLRLKVGGHAQTATTIIDNTPPEIKGYKIDGLEQVLGTEDIDYTFLVEAKDPQVGGVASDIDVTTTEIEKSNVPFNDVDGGNPKLIQGNFIEFKERTRLGSEESLELSIALQDWAGNRATKDETVADKLTFAGFTSDQSNQCSVGGAPYQTQAVEAPPRPTVPLEPLVPPPTTPKTPIVPPTAPNPPTNPAALALTIGQIILQAATDYADRHCFAPIADFKLQEANEDIPESRAFHTPFIYVNGRRNVKYHVGFGIIERETGKLDYMGTAAVKKVKLYANVAFYRERDGRMVFSKTIHALSNTLTSNSGPDRYIEWNGLEQGTNKPLRTDKYKVLMTLQRGIPVLNEGESFMSPNQPGKLREYYKMPPGFGLIYPEHTLVGFRVVNNIDGNSFPSTIDKPGKTQREHVESAFINFKNWIGPAGWVTSRGKTSHQWHHIVEKNQPGFTAEQLNSTHNLVRVPNDIHAEITNYYGNPDEDTTKSATITVRKWLADNHGDDWAYQHRFGLEILRENGWIYETQEDKPVGN